MAFRGFGQKLFAPPPGAPPAQQQQQQSQSYAPPAYAPPSAPPPQKRYAAPPGPPPPPSYEELASNYPSEPGVPPPPPPVLSWYASPALNASEDDAEAGWQFIAANPLTPPRALNPDEITALDSGNIHLLVPAHFAGYGTTSRSPTDGSTLVRTARGCRDTTLLSHVPLHAAWRPRADASVYYELQIVALGRDASVAIGFAAVPYPPFRLPGWHRGSIGVHADDGHRFACDADGGVPLTEPFGPGDVVGLGLELRTGQVWFTRNGALAGGWNLREGRTARADSFGNEWEGLDGRHDVYAAVGVCGEASAIVNLGGARAGRPWMWVPHSAA